MGMQWKYNIGQTVRFAMIFMLLFIMSVDTASASQYGRPNADLVVGSWTTAPLYQSIDETTRDDADFITSPNAGVSSTWNSANISLSSVRDPLSSSNHVLRYVYAKNAAGGQDINFRIRLLQGDKEIASFTHNSIPAIFTLQEQTLTSAQADSITDYSSLKIEVGVNSMDATLPQRKAEVSWVELNVNSPAGMIKVRDGIIKSNEGGVIRIYS